uniref:C2 domain-containing protein n=1 Tax=Hucho hucho TaxID=62062 RepID=A0A4W5JFE3_9TELE
MTYVSQTTWAYLQTDLYLKVTFYICTTPVVFVTHYLYIYNILIEISLSLLVVLLSSPLHVESGVFFSTISHLLLFSTISHPILFSTIIRCGTISPGNTEIINNNSDPNWSNKLICNDVEADDNLELEVWDDDAGPDDRLGTCTTTVHPGTHTETCHLKRGTVYYTYS